MFYCFCVADRASLEPGLEIFWDPNDISEFLAKNGASALTDKPVNFTDYTMDFNVTTMTTNQFIATVAKTFAHASCFDEFPLRELLRYSKWRVVDETLWIPHWHRELKINSKNKERFLRNEHYFDDLEDVLGHLIVSIAM